MRDQHKNQIKCTQYKSSDTFSLSHSPFLSLIFILSDLVVFAKCLPLLCERIASHVCMCVVCVCMCMCDCVCACMCLRVCMCACVCAYVFVCGVGAHIHLSPPPLHLQNVHKSAVLLIPLSLLYTDTHINKTESFCPLSE